MPDEQGRLVVGDRVWVHRDMDFLCDCEAVVTSVHYGEDGDDFLSMRIASDPDLPEDTLEDYSFHATFGEDTWKLENPNVTLLGPEGRAHKLRGIAKFYRKIEETQCD